MIKAIRFRNFKALRDSTLPLGRLNILVGPNGSGKSTALLALQYSAGDGIPNTAISAGVQPVRAKALVLLDVEWEDGGV